MHLAQLNVARLLAPLDSDQLRGFVEGLEPINALADASPGFVWRLQTEAGDATSIHAWDDPWRLLNMSVWESLDALRAFTYRGDHAEIMRSRLQWFERPTGSHLVLWWIPAGHLPTVEEALERLDRLERDGPGPSAFTFRNPFDPAGVAMREVRMGLHVARPNG